MNYKQPFSVVFTVVFTVNTTVCVHETTHAAENCLKKLLELNESRRYFESFETIIFDAARWQVQ